ncbi:hypothetical protein HSBAA_31450 [Vreelandella sulfidaeris]|uniref:Uncharacterized protein n=1 Tax=Vreelandella sulfidaeris TaxID=115553 RepID=A0A455UBD1_9GAMM|nr:hypothetical protein HSBAA_31450 [Halomonas sulfidaeris]
MGAAAGRLALDEPLVLAAVRVAELRAPELPSGRLITWPILKWVGEALGLAL